MAINNITNLDLGTFLQIVYSKGIFNQTSRDYSDWEMIKMNNIKIAPARSYDFQLSTSLAPASTQRRNPGSKAKAFPKGFKIQHEEYSAQFKEIHATIEIDGGLLARAAQSGAHTYAKVWETQAMLSMDGSRRVMASELYRDGTGALGHIASVVDQTGGRYEITLNNDRSTANTLSYAGWFELSDILTTKTRAGATGASGAAAFYSVISTDELNNKVVVQEVDSEGEPTDLGTDPVATEVFYRYGQEIFPDLTAAIADYGTVSTPIVGLESLAAADGRTVHGMDLEGALAGSQIDANGASIDVKFLEQALNKGKRRTGKSRYDWKKLCTSYQTRSAFIESKETDRRFVAVTDNARGSAEFNFIHGESQLRLTTSEYIPEDVLWMLPEVKGTGDKVLEYVGDEMKVAKYGNMPDFHFKNNASGERLDIVEQHMTGVNLLLCKHPAAILSVTNFKNQ